MDVKTIVIGGVVIALVLAIGFVALRSPTVQSSLGSLGSGEPPARDNTASDVGAVFGGIGATLQGAASFVGSLYGSAGGRSGSGVK